ncbi:uncharacterized mitochondrial protein-like protein [Tanacetum coccineum]
MGSHREWCNLAKTTTVEGVVTVMPITTAEEKAQRRLEVKARSTYWKGIPNEQSVKNKAELDTMSMDDLYNNLKVYEPELIGCCGFSDTVMSDSEDSTVTYTEVSSPFANLSDIGSLRVDGPPVMLEDPYAYVVAAFQAPPSPDYMLILEEPEQAPPLPVYRDDGDEEDNRLMNDEEIDLVDQAPSAEETEPVERARCCCARPSKVLWQTRVFDATIDREIRHDLERDVSYRITDTWEEKLVDMLGAPATDDTKLGRRMTEFATGVRQDTYEIYDRASHARTALLMERGARMSREAWGRSMDASDLACLEVMSLCTTVLGHQAVITELQAVDRRRQAAITELLATDRRRQARRFSLMVIILLDMINLRWRVTTVISWDTLPGKCKHQVVKEGFDLSDMTEEQVQTNMALMAFSDSKVYTDKTCSKTYLKNNETLKKQYDDLLAKLHQIEFKVSTYKRGLDIVEAQLVTYRKNEQEKDGIDFKFEKFDKASKDLDQLLGSQITDKKQVSHDKSSFIEGYGPNTSKSISEVEPKKVRKNDGAPTIEDWVSDDKELDESKPKSEKKTVIPTAAKIKFTKPENHEKPVKKQVSLMHKKYCLVVTDDYSRFTWVFFLTTKDETSEILKNFIKVIENLVDKKVKIIRSDNGTEFKNKVMDDFVRKGTVSNDSVDREVFVRNREGFARNSEGFARNNEGFARNSAPDSRVSRQFRVVRDNIIKHNANRETKPPAKSSVALPAKEPQILKASEQSPAEASKDLKLPSSLPVDSLSKQVQGVCITVASERNDRSGGKKATVSNVTPPVQATKPHDSQQSSVTSPNSSVIGVYSSSSDLVHIPSLVSRPAANVGAIKRGAVGVRRHTSEKSVIENSRSFPAVSKSDQSSHSNVSESAPIISTGRAVNNSRSHQPVTHQKVQSLTKKIIFGSTNKELCTGFEKLMKDKFQMSSMGELTFFLGLQVQQKEDGIFISQDKYVAEILKKFNYSDVKSASTPVDLEKPLVKDGDADDVDVHLYRSMIGSLMYLTASRPDIMFAVCACARFQVTPKTSHLLAVKRIFRYLKGKPTLGLWYSRDSPFELVAYTDSDYAGATLDRKSTTGGCQFLGNRLISWQCKKQTVVATSITKVEYVAAAINTARQKITTVKQMLMLLRGHGYQSCNCFQFLSLEALFERSLVVPLTKVGDEAVHKELGDRMEKAATTASSLEAEQNIGSGPRCQDTILGDVNAQTRFEITSIQSIDPPLSRGYTLRSGEDNMKLIRIDEILLKLVLSVLVSAVKRMLMLPVQVSAVEVIYTSCIEQFWATAMVQTVNGVRQIQALVDKKRVIVTESNIKRELYLNDAEGTDCLPTTTIFEELARMGYEKPSQKLTFYKAFFSP